MAEVPKLEIAFTWGYSDKMLAKISELRIAADGACACSCSCNCSCGGDATIFAQISEQIAQRARKPV
ncbi:MAG TPA: hypothetical protein PLE76_08755 [Rectinema sp.]|jgi:hypothetical protein|nr:hypothetical protein [Rectinema sp.]